ncbi:MAG: hypothetical protein ACFB10_05065 [Salibacteraceae bacterium]
MKKLLCLFAMAAFMFAFASSVQAQQGIKNATGCTQLVKFAYGNPFTCTATGDLTYTLAPFTSIWPLPIPLGQEIIAAKGAEISFACGPWYIGLPCSGYPPGVLVPCGVCGDYKVVLEPDGIILYQ